MSIDDTSTSREEPRTYWREMLSSEWQARRNLIDWKGIPEIHNYVYRLMSTCGGNEVENWLSYSRDRHLLPLLSKMHTTGLKPKSEQLSLVSFGCGSGSIEKGLFEHGWPLSKIVCKEYDTALLASAENMLSSIAADKRFDSFNFNNCTSEDGETYDVLFFCHSLHHCQNLERFLPYLNNLMHRESIVLGLDFFGPPRLQVEWQTRKIIERVFRILPERLRQNLFKEGQIDSEIEFTRLDDSIRIDPSECPRSSDLRSLFFSLFEPIDLLPMGGTLLQLLLHGRAGNYNTEDDMAILRLMMLLEEELIKSGRILSNELYFVCPRSNRL
jgi:hypothetical protein